MKVLVLNSGSSSIKYQLLEAPRWTPLASGVLEGIGSPGGRLVRQTRGPGGRLEEATGPAPVADHREGLGRVLQAIAESGWIRDSSDLIGIGHRVVHGGESFREPTLLDARVVEAIRDTVHLAPLHNPANLAGIETALALCPGVPQVAVFDTAFHQTMPPHAYRYALPGELYRRHGVRRYGFHGTSHACVARRAAALLRRPPQSLNLVTLHLGNGASAAAIQGGRSVDTSMGLTPLEGLVMGTRCGDLDPAVPLHLARTAGLGLDALESVLNAESGLKGLCGASDMREVLRREALGSGEAQLAVEMYCYRIRKYIGAYFAAMGRVDAVVFTAGVGENSASIRRRCCQGLSGLGIVLDEERNRSPSREAREIQAAGGSVKVLVIPTDEELEIARLTLECIENARSVPTPGQPGSTP